MATHFDEYEKQARQLEQIAKTLSKKSAKYAACPEASCLGAGFCHGATPQRVSKIPQ
jgi:hypothetical protein